MALISVKTILTSLSLFHITLGFFFLTNPGTIADQALVYVIGEAMGMPYARSFETQSPALAFLAVILATMGISDMVTLSQPEEIWLLHHWATQAPLRLFISFASFTYSFFFSASSPIYRSPLTSSSNPLSSSSSSSPRLTHPSAHAQPPPGYRPSGWGGDALKNRVFLTFAFVEMVSWFWVWVTLREERRDVAARRAQRRRSGQGYAY
ncbi:increased loss of mitochondrial DNA protein 1 [Phialemonium atrogriseum]|uniref:Increased loss of mitochondrial DNA protein 1 n=1 Tax=Phialemonium atrogriseum TaxID=1093897 RepID=A0AAJ0C760_9PEZI|nr:increased loss of mitochondrial DNA protein 1 [Phialemonium atrogriseum]KAK1770238.1 increased loss of mitochondrial DNA protein 1 [Phialemonium atrogriseum]